MTRTALCWSWFSNSTYPIRVLVDLWFSLGTLFSIRSVYTVILCNWCFVMVPFTITPAEGKNPFFSSIPLAPILSSWNIGREGMSAAHGALIDSLAMPIDVSTRGSFDCSLSVRETCGRLDEESKSEKSLEGFPSLPEVILIVGCQLPGR